MAPSSLEPGQYQIGDVVFGRKTLLNVESFDIAGYDINPQDYQSALSDEMRFGMDSLKPLPIQIIIHAFENRWLPNVFALSPPIETSLENSQVDAFVKEWHSDAVRSIWGEIKPLYVGRKDSSVVIIFGRPGKLAVTKLPVNGAYRTVTAEFRRSDTFAYNNFEWYLPFDPQEIITLTRTSDMGDAPAWMRFWIEGPADHPLITLSYTGGSMLIDVDVNLEADETLEVSSYPWARRVITIPEGINYSSRLTTPYLDQIKFPALGSYDVSWNATNTTGASKMYVLWRDTWNVV